MKLRKEVHDQRGIKTSEPKGRINFLKALKADMWQKEKIAMAGYQETLGFCPSSAPDQQCDLGLMN